MPYHNIPLDVLLSWPTPNYTDPVTRGPALVVLNILFLILSTIAVGLRLYVRGVTPNRLGLDDILIVFAYVFTIGNHTVLNIAVYRLDWGRHAWDVPPKYISPGFKFAYAVELLYLLPGYFTSVSLLAFYRRLNKESTIPWFTWAVYVSAFGDTVAWLVFFSLTIFQCTPISAMWQLYLPPGSRCINPKVVVFGGGIFKVFVDILITTLPIPLILRLKLSPSRKCGVVFLISLGYVVTIAGAVRAYYAYLVVWKTYDTTWYNYPGFLAGTIENDLGIICACAPAARSTVLGIYRKFSSFLSSISASTSTWLRSTSDGLPFTKDSKSSETTATDAELTGPPGQSHYPHRFGARTFWKDTTVNSTGTDMLDTTTSYAARTFWVDNTMTSTIDDEHLTTNHFGPSIKDLERAHRERQHETDPKERSFFVDDYDERYVPKYRNWT